MGKFPRQLWQDMTTVDFASLDRERTIAVLPVAAVEQHGPHLPVWVDACINQGIVEHVLRHVGGLQASERRGQHPGDVDGEINIHLRIHVQSCHGYTIGGGEVPVLPGEVPGR